MVTLSLIMHQVGLQIDATIQINDWLIDSLDLIGQERITARFNLQTRISYFRPFIQ